MAMLAEPRRKQKFSVDPRNISWSNDDGKIGQKLMEKMGWSKGKGLGANEDGKTEHVAVNVKNDTRGVGCSKNHADNWIAHQDDFNSLLASLNQENNSTPNSDVEKVISLEHKSKTAKGRLHYQKFTKGKDLSLKSGQDLDCVFGKRKSHSGSNTPLPGSESGSEDDDKLHGIQTVTSTDSIQDYFKKKMADRKNRLENESKSAVPGNQNNISDNDFEENAHGLVCIKQEQETVDIFKTKMSKKKKSKKSKDCLMNSNLNEAVIETIVDGESEPSTEPVKKPKKKTKRKKEEIKNEITDISCDNVKEEFDASAEGKVKKKSKKRKKEKCKKSDGSDVKFVIGCEVDDDGDQPIKKVKNRRIHN
ncbi:PIN2/TERF1-interacting telomerase inhibitor 1-like isoform X2 [Dreissena polymorpha]|uniref:PIN2/TERF1-interacting telomerase inhibitor 1-like isoform X2 n=1 Tax=Dreissena polymorpha TaxID=45954 RepID=UPI002264573B|nr:PIN2/TERF1-interacting telomerase inhibitor 1-like isoform X2 [Dreissena polymorpha]